MTLSEPDGPGHPHCADRDLVDAMLLEENWEPIACHSSHKVYRKYNTTYDMIEIITLPSGKYRVSVPMKTSTYAYSTYIEDQTKLFLYISEFVEHYEHYHGEHINDRFCSEGE